jgi:hypothetical protein
MKLAKGSKHQILGFENEAIKQLQFSSLNSKLNVRMILLWNVLICAANILIGKDTFIVEHNRMIFGWCGIFTKRKQMKKMILLLRFQKF